MMKRNFVRLLAKRCLHQVETGPLPKELSIAPHLSPNATLNTQHPRRTSSCTPPPSSRYSELCRAGRIKHDIQQERVINEFDHLWSELPRYQDAMELHAAEVRGGHIKSAFLIPFSNVVS